MQRNPRRRRQQPERRVVRHEHGCLGCRPRRRSAEPEPGALVEGAVAHHGVGCACSDGHRGLHDCARCRAASVVHAAEECQVADADVPRDVDLVARVHREGDHAVDIAGLQPGVIDRCFDCLARELEFTAPRLLRKLGLADACDGCLAAQAHLVSSRLMVAVPDTWSPRLLLPLKPTSTNPSPSTPWDLSVTLPVNRSGSFGNDGTPNRIASLVTIASGPAQSVRNRTHSPLVVRMFMNMLGEPCFFANSGSGCTGMKSGDAIAPATITVAVTGISSGVTWSPTLTSCQSSVVVRIVLVIGLLLRIRRRAAPTAPTRTQGS